MSFYKTLGILGGLGPIATMDLCRLIVNRTEANCDQDHINMIIFNHASIPDRTNFILGKSKDNPLIFMQEDAIKLEELGADFIVIPCNTAHYFYDEIKKCVDIPIVHMIDETVKFVKNKNINSIGILATTGTVKTNLYQDFCLKYGIDFQTLDHKYQDDLMYLIYDCIKAGKKANMDIFNEIILSLKEKNCDAVIMGCTELSVLKNMEKLNDFYIDPMEIVADLCIKACGKLIKE